MIFVPTNISPHKDFKEIVSAKHRLKMLNLAIEENPNFLVSDIELQRQGKSYSVETILHFKQMFQNEAEIFFVLGMDSFMEINTWKNYRDLFSLCNFIIMTRPGYEVDQFQKLIPPQVLEEFKYNPEEKIFLHHSNYFISVKKITAIDISSCSIRMLLKKGLSARYLLPEKVRNYICEHELYKE
jgi:nicotinate-nucleotide adenylyltransferase